MGNGLQNTGFLDGSTGWTVTGGALTVDETTHGEAGRMALIATGNTASLKIASAGAARAPVTAGGRVEALLSAVAWQEGGVVAPAMSVTFYNGAGAVVGPSKPLKRLPAQITRHGAGLLGVRNSYDRGYARLTVPAGAVSAGVEVVCASGAVAARKLALVKPMLAMLQDGRDEPLVWDPGSHTAADLKRPVWPSILPGFAVTPGGKPEPDRVEFKSAGGRPIQRRVAADPARRFTARLRCDAVQRAALEQFWRTTDEDFWFLEPDSDRLCVASFAADGGPHMTDDLGVVSVMEFSLWLETA